MRRRVAALASLSAACGAGAQGTTAPAPEPQRIEIKGEVQQSDAEQRRRETVAKTVYGREELDKYGDTSVTDVLKRLPGINLTGGNPRMRGLGAGYTLILINGEPAPPGFSLENLPPSQVERIEVTKGPTAERSAQAVAGTINIILRAVPRQRQRELNLRASYTAQRPVPGFNANFADRHGDLSVALPFSGYQWAGDTPYETARTTRDTAGLPQALLIRGLDRWWGGGGSFGPRLSWKPSDKLTLEWQTFAQRHNFRTAGAYRTEVLSGSAPSSVDDDFRLEGHWQMLRTGLSQTQRFDGGARLEARLGVQASDSASDNRGYGRNAQGAQTIDRLTATTNAEQVRSTSGKFTRPIGQAHTLATGWDLENKRRRETRAVTENGRAQLQDFEGEPFYSRVQRQAAFVQDEWEIGPQWSTYLGLRSERIATSSHSSIGTVSSSSQVTTPVLHLNHKLDPKGRDMLRLSLTRAYKAPDPSSLLARPVLNNNYPTNTPNPENGPDRVGNPALKPELSTGIDLAFERYFAAGGVMSIGAFHRRITGLVRNTLTLERVPWATVPRWVAKPVNLRGATSTGLEFELKGRAADLLPLAAPPADLQLRASFSLYRSRVDELPGPDNRLEQQQPWSLNLGFDGRVDGTPLGYGASLAYTPAYLTQQTASQMQRLGTSRQADGYLSWTWSREAVGRLSVNNLRPLSALNDTQTVEQGGTVLSNRNERRNHAQWTASLALKF